MKPFKLGVSGHYAPRVHKPAAASPLISLRAIGSLNPEGAEAAAARYACSSY